jgi:hypothetical protein
MFTATEANALSQQAVAAFKKKQTGNSSNYNSSKPIVCYHCNKPGHCKSECKQLLNNNSKQNGSGSSFNKNGSGKSNWKKIPPRSGDPQTKTVDNIEYHWCSKCGDSGRWSPSHGTSEHTGGPPTSTSRYTRKPETNVASTGLAFDWDSDDWDVEANMVNIPYAQRYRTLVDDNMPQEVFGVLVDTDDGGDIIAPRTDRCEECGDRGPVGHWCSECQDGSLYAEASDTSSIATHISLGKCFNCAKVGAVGYSCDEQACATNHAIFTRQAIMIMWLVNLCHLQVGALRLAPLYQMMEVCTPAGNRSSVIQL